MHNRSYLLWSLSVALSLMTSVKVEAQLTPDNTLGKENSIVNSVDLRERIDGGAIRGFNLFHSFQEFNIDNEKSVYFSNPTAIKNILTRITGKNSSSILGKLGVLGNANLFLINPNGIFFGQNASLDISGSFTATTSPSIFFDNNFEFSAINPQTVPLLKINITPGLQYSRSQQGDIANQGNLTVGKDLNLIGQNLNLTGRLNAGRNLNLKALGNLQIRDNFNNPFIASADKNLLLQGNQTIDIEALSNLDSGLFSGNDLILQSSNPVLGDAHYFSGGSFRIEQLDGSLGDFESPKDPIIRASGNVSFDSYGGASLHILAGGAVNIAGNITIINTDGINGLEETITLSTGENLVINGKTQATLDIRAGTTKFGNPGITGNIKLKPQNPNTQGIRSNRNIFIGGNIQIKKQDGLVFLSNHYGSNPNLTGGNIQIKGNINTGTGAGNGGNVIIDSIGDIEITNFIKTDSRNTLNPNAGNISINTAGSLRVSNNIQANSLAGSSGRISLSSKGPLSIVDGAIIESESNRNNISADEVIGGDIKLTAPSIIVEDNSQVIASTGGLGKAGNLIIEAEEVNFFDGSVLGSVTGKKFADSGDIIFINTEILNLNNRAEINTKTSNGISGNIHIPDLNTLILNDNSLISANTFNGQAGNINISAVEEVKIKNQSRIVSRATDKGNSGSILIQANDVSLSNGGKISVTTKSGTSGNIQLQNLNTLQLNDNSAISATTSDGTAGNILVNAIDSINIETSSKLASEAVSDGIAGNININTNQLEISANSQASVNSEGNGNAGNILINANDILLLDKAKISAKTTESGTDGNITINSLNSLELFDSSIGASTYNGEAGDIKINATNIVKLLANSHISSKAKESGIAGELNITTNQLQMADSSYINVSAKNNGTAGNILINAKDAVLNNQANISATTEFGNSGNIILQNLQTLLLNQSSFISADTIDGKAGNITVQATDLIKLENGSKLESQAFQAGIAGSIMVDTNQFTISDKAKVTVSSKLGQAGKLEITANNLFLNQGKLTAETAIGQGKESGSIMLFLNDLLLIENNSLISAKAFDNADGGNITINNPNGFVIGLPLENSDITADAAKGNGGNIDVTTLMILGLKFTNQRIPKSDISASSKFGINGQVTVNQLSVDPSFSLVHLPSTFTEKAKIQPGCAASAGNNFVISGRGGLPQSPNDLFDGNGIFIELIDSVFTQTSASNSNIYQNSNIIKIDNQKNDNQKNNIIEATEWIKDTDGNVIFVAKVPQPTSQNPGVSSASCQNFSTLSE